ncbi:MAG TPA: 16S rRNA (cytidine(1402)-2'-O)-methyltransferase [Burkholderiales bacterium]|nr:16S rRNA (cytidine(1402)-2'-O)-methyltransferase [Burkholderiales bacterium]
MATPIGNLRDISLRALDVLKDVDAVIAEDTRVTARLLARYGIARRLIPAHEHNERRAIKQVLALLTAGRSLALTCDAGTPAISDPGALVVEAVRAAGFAVTPIPGPNAAVAALSAAGRAAPHFLFYGFLPQRAAERRRALALLKTLPYALVFYEAPHRVVACLADLRDVLGGERDVVIARELTKVFESISRCTLASAAAWIAENAERARGEFVLIVQGAQLPKRGAEEARGEAHRTLAVLLEEVPLKQAVTLAVKLSGGKRNDLYELALTLKGKQ